MNLVSLLLSTDPNEIEMCILASLPVQIIYKGQLLISTQKG